ncbi:hypothetical protein GGP41_002464 [Bipolaris sorokiniana]|uniref:Uncharacterized protein n=1 Tax=Cochliobolus sativus TaxID=45130 RepID=A0A8H5ZHA5_COCSA|nr:hypothetical protein GGP41_002464 [Bipolaris sorokiniana]
MGNQSSTPNANKLSKPKTNTNSVNTAYKSDSPECSFSGPADLSSHVDIADAIKLLQQVKKNGSPEDIAALQQVLEMPEENDEPVGEPSSSRRMSAVDKSSSTSLTRRQSLLQTPGVGTRSSPVEARRRTWNSWRSARLEYDDEIKSKSSPHAASHLNLTMAKSSTDIAQADPRPRVSTPCDLDYSQLGSLKPGTLVITNGPASPASSIRASIRPHGEDEDYFSETEPGSSPLMMKSTRRRGHVRSQSAILPATSSLQIVETMEVPLPYETAQSATTVKLVRSADESIHIESPNQSHDSLEAVDNNPVDVAHSVQSSQAHLAPSPSPVSEEDRTVSKDEGFTSDDTHYPKSEDTCRSQDLASGQVASQTTARNLAPPGQSTPVQKKPKNRTKQRPPPRTTDSGYSSGGSLPIDEREQQAGSTYTICSQCQCHSSQPSHGASQRKEGMQPGFPNQNKENMHMSGSSVSAARAVRGIRGPGALVTVQSSRALRPKSSLQVSVNSASSSARSSTSEGLLSPRTPRSVSSKSSFDSAPGKPPKRLHRRRPSQGEALIVQSCQPIPEGKIPDVPADVRAQFERRVTSTPGMDCLTQTYLSKDHVVAEDSKPNAPLPGHTEFQQLVELQVAPPPMPSASSHRRSFSFFRRKSMGDSRETQKAAADIAIEAGYLEHIAASIGTSPYAAVTPDLPKQTVASAASPHRLGAVVPRSKSMVNMDSKAAAEFARAHSRDLAASREMLPQQRRKSFHSLKVEAGEARAMRHRPQNFDVPPVPSIDMAKLSGPNTTQQSKRHSIGTFGPNTGFRPHGHQRSQTAHQLASKSSVSLQKTSQQSMQWEAPSRPRAQRRKTIGEGMRSMDAIAVASSKRASVGPGIKVQGAENLAAWGRYSGGLAYDYEGRGIGVGGSAGTRQVHSCASIKSLHYQHQYGVDLSDVPIMVQRL